MGGHLLVDRMAVFKAGLISLVLALAGCVASPAPASGPNASEFDALFARASTRWVPRYDWRWLKAQCYQESRFNVRAVSSAGARGLCQFMPATWAEAQRALGVRNVYSARENTWAAGWYMRRMLAIWTSRRTDRQRLKLAQASYNAGAGNIIEAQRRCDGALTWPFVRRCLPQVTGRHADETIEYVRNIERWFGEITCSES